MGKIKYDAIIHGNNISAAIAAIALMQKGQKVLLAGKNTNFKWPDHAVASLNHNSLKFLKSLQIIPQEKHFYNCIDVKLRHSQLKFNAYDAYANTLGCIVPLQSISDALTPLLNNIDQTDNDNINDWQNEANYLITSKPLLSESKRAKPLSHQIATASIYRECDGKTAWQWFDDGEIIGQLPTAKPQHFALIHSSPKSYEAEALLKRLQTLCPNVRQISNLSSYKPVRIGHYTPYVQNNVISIHQACYEIHPMSGFSLNMALSDIKALSKTFPDNLMQYTSDRQGKNSRTISMIQSLYQLYCDPGFESSIIDWSVNLINQSDWLKQFFIDQAENV